MRKAGMKKQDLIELWQLINMYQRIYHPEGEKHIQELMEEISMEYRDTSRGGEISVATNPRNAGRKNQYTEEHGMEIVRLHGQGMSVRETARQMGCSAGHVQDILKSKK